MFARLDIVAKTGTGTIRLEIALESAGLEVYDF